MKSYEYLCEWAQCTVGKVKNASRIQRLLLLGVCICIICLFVNLLLVTNYVKFTLKYEPTGTTQTMAMLEYVQDDKIISIVEPIEDFSVEFEVKKNPSKIEDVSVCLGDQSGTVRIEKIVIETKNKEVVLTNENLLDYFSIDDAYSHTQEEGYFEIFTYDISLTSMKVKDGAWQDIISKPQMIDWSSFYVWAFGAVLIFILIARKIEEVENVPPKMVKVLRWVLPCLFTLCMSINYLLGMEDMTSYSVDATDIWKTIKTFYSEDVHISYVLYKGFVSVYPYVWLYQMAVWFGVNEFFFVKIFHAIIASYILGMGFPSICESVLGKKVKTESKIIYIYILFLLQIGNYAFTQVVIDLPYLFWFTLMLHMYVRLRKCSAKHRYWEYVLLGLSIGFCNCFTGQYKFSAILICLLLGNVLWKNIKGGSVYQWIARALVVFIMISGVLIAENIFQSEIVEEFRQEEGIWLPTAEALVQYQFTKEEPNAVWAYKGIPPKDYQIMAIIEAEEPQYAGLSSTGEIIREYLRVGLKHPGEFIVSYANKFFMLFAAAGEQYVLVYYWLSYSLTFLGIWVIYTRRKEAKESLSIFVTMFLAIIVPCVTHVEGRYAMSIQNFLFGLAIFGNDLWGEVKILAMRLRCGITKNRDSCVHKNEWTVWITFIYICFMMMCIMHISNLSIMNWIANGNLRMFE